MRKSIATVSLSGTLEEKLAAAGAAGFDGVEIFENDLITCPLRPEEVRSLAAEVGVRIELYQPFRDCEAMPPDVFERTLGRAARKFEVMTRLGAGTLLVCSNCSAAAMDDDSLAAEQLHRMADAAAAWDIRVAYEALAWARHVNDFRRSWRIVEMAAHPNLGVCLDSFHILSRGDDPSEIRRIPGDRIFCLQLADAPRLLMDVLQWSRRHRCFPGQGDFDLTGFLADVVATGFEGPLSLEVFNDVFRRSEPERTAVDAMRSLLTLEESLQPGSPPPTVTHPERARIPVDIREVPAAVELHGFAFVEVAVDEASGQAAAGALRSLGFTHTAQHRRKPVQLWEQGEARVLLNAGDRRLLDELHGNAFVSGLAVDSADPGRSTARARALLAPTRPRSHNPGEADFSEIAAPDGTAIFFCHTDELDPRSWRHDFVQLRPGGSLPGIGLMRVDHVALGQPFGLLDEAALFSRAVLDLRPEESHEFAAPYGLVRSLALSGGREGIRIVLSVPVVAGGRERLASLQHVAFESRDIFETARSVRELGPVLPISANYYDDLAARFDLDATLLDTLREHNILYDRDEGGGVVFHFCTPALGEGLFFEVVQRFGSYRGLGAPNAAVGVAAQQRAIGTCGGCEGGGYIDV